MGPVISLQGINKCLSLLLFLLLLGCRSESEQRTVLATEEPENIEVKNTVVFPLLSFQGNMSSLNFFNRQTQSIEHIIESQSEQQFIDAHLVGERIYALKEDLRGNEVTLLQVLDREGNDIHQFELPGAHHTIAPFEDKIAYIETFEYSLNGRIWLLDRVVSMLPDSQQQNVLLSVTDVLVLEDLAIAYSQNGDMWDITHANTIRWDVSQQLFVLTLAGLNAIWTFDVDGQIKGVYLGYQASSEAYKSGAVYSGGTFHHPHGAVFDQAGRLWVLSTTDGISQVHGYTVDGQNLQLQTSVTPPYEDFQSLAGGNVLLDSNGLIIDWGFAGLIEERTFSQDSVWTFESPIGFGMGFATLAP